MAKIEINGVPFSPCVDRFCTAGYRKPISAMETLEAIASVPGIEGIPVGLPTGFENLTKTVDRVKELGFTIGTFALDGQVLPEWKDGILMNRNPIVRRDAIKMTKELIDACAEFPGADVLLWLSNDGYDYAFEDDYAARFDLLMESLSELCEYRPEVKISLEYKPKEPRQHQYISDYGKTMFICEKLGYKNLGLVVDIGHSLYGGESPAEAVAIANKYGYLHHIHMNDNYRSWDDDMIVGSVHFWETLEMVFELEAMGYDGWYTLDIWPARCDGYQAIEESVKRTQMFIDLAKTLPKDEIRRMQAENDVVKTMKLVRELTVKW